jgi:hypothetical protein
MATLQPAGMERFVLWVCFIEVTRISGTAESSGTTYLF